jgi:hypothetical protein
MRVFVLLITAALAACSGSAPPEAGSTDEARPLAKEVTFTRGTGGSVVTTLGYGIRLNPGSSLEREWIAAHDTRLPVDLKGTTGVRTVYVDGGRYSSGEYQYRSSITIAPTDSLAAIEVRFILFDVWGEHTKTLSMTEIVDIPGGEEVTFTPQWRLWSENEAEEFYASLGYIARVRLRSGKVFEADYDPIVAEARKIYSRFAPEDLDPNRRPPPDSTVAK